MCWCSEEMVDHLLIHYMVAYNLWSFVFRCFDIHWVLLGKVMDVMFNWRN